MLSDPGCLPLNHCKLNTENMSLETYAMYKTVEPKLTPNLNSDSEMSRNTDNDDTEIEIKDESKSDLESNKCELPRLSKAEQSSLEKLFTYKCKKCNSYKPPRSHH